MVVEILSGGGTILVTNMGERAILVMKFSSLGALLSSQLSYVAKISPANKFRAEADDYGFLEEIGRGIRKNYASNLEMTENAIFPSFYVTSL